MRASTPRASPCSPSGAALTSGALSALTAVDAHPGRALELAVLLAASAAATLLRFVLFRRWIFAPTRRPPPPDRLASPVPPQPASPTIGRPP